MVVGVIGFDWADGQGWAPSSVLSFIRDLTSRGGLISVRKREIFLRSSFLNKERSIIEFVLSVGQSTFPIFILYMYIYMCTHTNQPDTKAHTNTNNTYIHCAALSTHTHIHTYTEYIHIYKQLSWERHKSNNSPFSYG